MTSAMRLSCWWSFEPCRSWWVVRQAIRTMKRLQPEILEKHAAILSRLLADEEMFWRVGRSLAMLLHRNTAQMGSLKGNANKIFLLYLYISQHVVVTFPNFSGSFFWWKDDSVSNSPTLARIGMCVLQPSAPFQGEQFMFSSCYRFLWKKALLLRVIMCQCCWKLLKLPTMCRLSNPSDVSTLWLNMASDRLEPSKLCHYEKAGNTGIPTSICSTFSKQIETWCWIAVVFGHCFLKMGQRLTTHPVPFLKRGDLLYWD